MKFMVMLIVVASAIIWAMSADSSKAETPVDKELKTGTIKGSVLDKESNEPLAGASVIIDGTPLGSKVDTKGSYSIANVPVGSYTLRINLIGYESISRPDVIVKSKRITFVNVELLAAAYEMGDVMVTAGFFPETEDKPTSVVEYSSEEIRRAPGSAGDVSRIMMTLPSIAKINDQVNSLIVRGGSPVENGFYVDGIEIPNINHYPTQGSSGGPIGLINVDFIRDAEFSAGGFSAAYADRLSSVMDIAFREGNRDEFDGQVDLSFAGVGGVVEGPMYGNKGSYLLSARKSYLDLLVDAIGTGVAPKYSDYQGKLVYDLSGKDKVTVIDILGLDFIEFTKDQSIEDGNIIYGSTDIDENAGGLNWRHLWGKGGYSNLILSNMYTRYKNDFYETRTDSLLGRGTSAQSDFTIRNVNYWRFNQSHSLEFGFQAKRRSIDIDYLSGAYTDVFGDTISGFSQNRVLNANSYGGFLNYKVKPLNRVTANLGVRADYFSLNGNTHAAPRFSMSFQLSDKMSINGSTGIYYQNLPISVLAYPEENKNLKDPYAYHFILGMNYLLAEDTKLTLEIYNKQYHDFPMDPAQRSLFIEEEIFYRYGFYFAHENLQSVGRARAYGIEAYAQKKLAARLYGLIGGSYFKTQYRDLDGTWRNRVFDNRYLFSIEGGYKPNNRWEFSLRWIFAGGPPYTPLDLSASAAIHRAVFDASRINEARYPAYHSLNIRFDRRYNFKGTNLIFYISIWNAYNRKNVANYYWNEIDNKEDVVYQWSLLPVGGFEYEF